MLLKTKIAIENKEIEISISKKLGKYFAPLEIWKPKTETFILFKTTPKIIKRFEKINIFEWLSLFVLNNINGMKPKTNNSVNKRMEALSKAKSFFIGFLKKRSKDLVIK